MTGWIVLTKDRRNPEIPRSSLVYQVGYLVGNMGFGIFFYSDRAQCEKARKKGQVVAEIRAEGLIEPYEDRFRAQAVRVLS